MSSGALLNATSASPYSILVSLYADRTQSIYFVKAFGWTSHGTGRGISFGAV